MFFICTILALCTYPFIALWYTFVLVTSPFVRAYRTVRRAFHKTMSQKCETQQQQQQSDRQVPQFINENGRQLPFPTSENKKRHRRGHRGGRKHHKKG